MLNINVFKAFLLKQVCSTKFKDNFTVRLLRTVPTKSIHSVSHLLKKWMEQFNNFSISDPKQSIENILAHILKKTRISDIYKSPNKILNPEEVQELNSLCEKRLKKMPIQYVIEEWQFRQLTLKMSPPVFIPRPETEMLVDLVLQEIAERNCKHVLELCCGSGAISLSLLQENSDIRVTAIDQSQEACCLTKTNAAKHNLLERIDVFQYVISDCLDFVTKDKFEIIVSNPPYLFAEDMSVLQPEIALYEDLQALNGGENGLEVIKNVLKLSSFLLCNNGKLFLEVDPRHPVLINSWLNSVNLGLKLVCSHKDFCRKLRFVEIIKI